MITVATRPRGSGRAPPCRRPTEPGAPGWHRGPPPPQYVIVRRTRAGTPAATENGGMSDVTTEFAPMTQRSPIVTPVVTTTFTPHHTLSPIRVGPLVVKPCHGTGLSGSSNRCEESVT